MQRIHVIRFVQFLISFAVVSTADAAGEPRSALIGYAIGPDVGVANSDLRQPTLRPFTSDGCSVSPDRLPFSDEFTDCCVEHDISYWLGGTRTEKSRADQNLKQCMAQKGLPRTGRLYEVFVAKFGSRSSHQHFRWGYGWNYQRPYRTIDPSEEKQIFLLYGVDAKSVPGILRSQKIETEHREETYDQVFYGLSRDEFAIYGFLNLNLREHDVVADVIPGYFNLERREILVRTRNCPSPFLFTFKQKAKPNEPPIVTGGCTTFP